MVYQTRPTGIMSRFFLFHHSCSHDKQRADGLTAESMLRGYGGKQGKLRDTAIDQEACLEPFTCTLSIGDTQSFVVETGDIGPFYLDAQQQEAKNMI
jgi:hypothetical protein